MIKNAEESLEFPPKMCRNIFGSESKDNKGYLLTSDIVQKALIVWKLGVK